MAPSEHIEGGLRTISAGSMISTLRKIVLCIVATLGLIAGVAVLPAEAGTGSSDVMWFNPSTGAVASWLLNGSGHVTGTQQLSYTCSTSSGCASQWHPIGIANGGL